MNKKLMLISLLLISVMAAVQGADFSGKWKLNPAKSKLSAEYSMAPKEMILIQQGNDLSIEKHATFQEREIVTNDKFTLDGKECINKGWRDTEKKSVAVVSEDKMSIRITTTIAMGNNGEMKLTEEYKIDGKELVVVATGSSSFGERSETFVFGLE